MRKCGQICRKIAFQCVSAKVDFGNGAVFYFDSVPGFWVFFQIPWTAPMIAVGGIVDGNQGASFAIGNAPLRKYVIGNQ